MSRRRCLLRAALAGAIAPAVGRVHAHEYYLPGFKIIHPWSMPTPDGADTAAVFMKFEEIALDDRLVGAESEIAEGVEMAGGSRAPAIDFALHGGVDSELADPGAYLRLVGLRRPLRVGLSHPLRLSFERAGSVDATFVVEFRFR